MDDKVYVPLVLGLCFSMFLLSVAILIWRVSTTTIPPEAVIAPTPNTTKTIEGLTKHRMAVIQTVENICLADHPKEPEFCKAESTRLMAHFQNLTS